MTKKSQKPKPPTINEVVAGIVKHTRDHYKEAFLTIPEGKTADDMNIMWNSGAYVEIPTILESVPDPNVRGAFLSVPMRWRSLGTFIRNEFKLHASKGKFFKHPLVINAMTHHKKPGVPVAAPMDISLLIIKLVRAELTKEIADEKH